MPTTMPTTMPTIGDQPCIRSTDADEREAAKWALEQKRQFWKNLLSQQKVDALNSTEGWTWLPVGHETWADLGFTNKKKLTGCTGAKRI
jgi:hypothetical protein